MTTRSRSSCLPVSAAHRQLHATPADIAAVLRDYAKVMIVSVLGLYTHDLLADSTMMDAFVGRDQAHRPLDRSPLLLPPRQVCPGIQAPDMTSETASDLG
jgi:hypothetical protein